MFYELMSDAMVAFICAACFCGLVGGFWLVGSALNGLIPKDWK